MSGSSLPPGAYESVVTEALAKRLQALDSGAIQAEALPTGEIPDRLGMVAAELVERTLQGMSDEDRATAGSELIRDLALRLIEHSRAVDSGDLVLVPAQVLRSISAVTPTGGWHRPGRPLTPLLDTTVLTGANGEPTLSAQISSEIASADSIDVIMAFIRVSGLRPILGQLREHAAGGRSLRVLTTTYTGSTEQRALDLLAELGAEIRVSYDETGTRLHAKSWLFHRHSGLSTAYVGSSNLTHQAQVTGLEWNVRLSGRRNSQAVEKLGAVFSAYWHGGDFVSYDPEEFRRHEHARAAPAERLALFEITPHPFQRRMLEQIALARGNGQHRNLVVAATGTGKTVLAALDYKRLRTELASSRLLFLAHRQEILEQSLATFRQVVRDASFGELWVGGERPDHFHHVFASIQSLAANAVERLGPTHFDVVIVDEFHHAAAATYDRLLQRVQPRELLGLTATPERTDGQSVLHWFDNRITVELRLWDAIDQQRLVPFHYFGVDDGSDLRSVPRRGREYDVEALSAVYTADSLWASRVLREVYRLVPDVERMTALGFCASVSHATFTAEAFNRAGVPSDALSGTTPARERARVLADLRSGRLRAVFSVDVLSEGVDVPEVDTIFLMRPTESATVFLQQLGRGLRRLEGKAACLVLDFIGVQAEAFRFDLRFRALLGGGRAALERAIKEDFPYLPAGCQLVLEPSPARRILDSLRSAIPGTWPQQVRELAALSAQGDVSLGRYLAESGLDLDDVYRGAHSWVALRADAGLPVPPAGAHEGKIRPALGRLLHVDDQERLSVYSRWLADTAPPEVSDERSGGCFAC